MYPRIEPRLNKKMKALFNNQEVGIIENISKHGGFIKVEKNQLPKKDSFDIILQVSRHKSIQLRCKPQWSNEKGVGFQLLSIEDAKKDQFFEYIDRQFNFEQQFGNEKKFRTEIHITLEHTNVFGNVYFANYFKYQGIARERMLLKHVPDAFVYFMSTGINLATKEAHNTFIKNSYFSDYIIAEVTTSDIGASSVRLNIKFRNKTTNELLGEGYQVCCCVNVKTGRPVKMPKIFDYLQYYEEVKE